MKVAILTTHRANNFGAMLQAYSLVSTCRELGADAEILDWRCSHFEWLYHNAVRIQRNPFLVIKHLLWYVAHEKASRVMFDSFRKLIPVSRVITKRRDLPAMENYYDIFIVGSDQVWNPINSANNPLLFDRSNLLDFVHRKKKYSYAASIGGKRITPESLCTEFISAWKTFDGITMREHAGSDFVEKVSGRKTITVVDPVLLQGARFWMNLAVPPPRQGGFVLLYGVRGSAELKAMAERYAKKEGLSVVDLLIPGVVGLHEDLKVNAGPAEFIGYINKARCVFTGSFHASAFSLLFGKKLFVQMSKDHDNVNSRLDTLFTWGKLTGEKVCERSDYDIVFYDCSRKDTECLEKERLRCRGILAEMVKGLYKA